MRYCHGDQINAMRQPAIMLKSTFLAKARFLKHMGKKNKCMKDFDVALEDEWNDTLKKLNKRSNIMLLKDKNKSLQR